jgi:hypothetical protein
LYCLTVVTNQQPPAGVCDQKTNFAIVNYLIISFFILFWISRYCLPMR